MSRRILTIVIAAAVAVLVLATGITASAASLGGLTSRSLGAWVLAGGTGAPTVGVWDPFTRPNGTNLNGQATGGSGAAWQVVSGTWTTTGNAGRLSSTTADAAIVADCGASEATVVATLTLGSPTYSAGLTLLRGPVGFISVDYSSAGGGTIEISRTFFGNRSVLASITGVGRTSPVTLSASYTGGTITVQLNGVSRLSHTLSPTLEWFYGSNTEFGLYADGDTQTTFDNVRCEH
jgi:hypothetical protein